jgi:hypothetical protein
MSQPPERLSHPERDGTARTIAHNRGSALTLCFARDREAVVSPLPDARDIEPLREEILPQQPGPRV